MDYFDGKVEKKTCLQFTYDMLTFFAKAAFVYLNKCGDELAKVSKIVLSTDRAVGDMVG